MRTVTPGAPTAPDPRPHTEGLRRWEIVGAWLHLWTPPRGLDPPPVPWRRILLVVAVLVAVGVPAAVVGLGAIGEEKTRRASDQRRAERAAAAARTRDLIRDQRAVPRSVAIPAGTSPARARARLEAAMATAVAEEAHRRFATGELPSDTVERPALCRPLAGAPPGALRLTCEAVTSIVRDGEGRRVGHIGYSFVAQGSWADGRFAICKSNPPPGEGAVRWDMGPALPAVCRGAGG